MRGQKAESRSRTIGSGKAVVDDNKREDKKRSARRWHKVLTAANKLVPAQTRLESSLKFRGGDFRRVQTDGHLQPIQ